MMLKSTGLVDEANGEAAWPRMRPRWASHARWSTLYGDNYTHATSLGLTVNLHNKYALGLARPLGLAGPCRESILGHVGPLGHAGPCRETCLIDAIPY